MAKQNSLIKIEGALDGLSFKQTKDGYTVKKLRPVSKSVMETSDKFKRTRENWNEFRNGAGASRILRAALKDALSHGKDSRIVSRLTQQMIKVAKSDPDNNRGERVVANGDISMLKDFNFNIGAVLNQCLKLELIPVFERTTGKVTLNIPTFDVDDTIQSPSGATHFRIHVTACEINFETGESVVKYSESDPFATQSAEVAAFTIPHQLTAQSTNPLFCVAGICFYDMVNGKLYPLRNGGFNALGIIGVNRP